MKIKIVLKISIKILLLVFLPVNGMASDVWSGDQEFKGWKGKGDSNPYKNMSTSAVINNVPVVSDAELLTKGKIYLEEGEYKKAIKSYEQAIRAQQDTGEAYKGIGLAYFKLGHNEHSSNPEVLSMALSALERSLSIKQDAEVYYTLGLSYLALDDKKKAETALQNLKSINSSLAATLEAKIVTYGAPRNYTFVRNPETERIEAEEAKQRQEARRRSAERQEALDNEQLRDNYNQQSIEIQNLESMKSQMESQKRQLEFEKSQMKDKMRREKSQMQSEQIQLENEKRQIENEMQSERMQMENEKRQLENEMESQRMRFRSEQIRNHQF